jgi:hypothetical protein
MFKLFFIMRIDKILFPCFMTLIFYSCSGQKDNMNCIKKFEQATKIAYSYPPPANQLSLDTALRLVNESLICDTVKKAAVDLKITLLTTMGKYSEGMKFVDSLKESDFTYGYKKKLIYKNFQALRDTTKRNIVYAEIASILEQYIKQHSMNDKEFKEIYTDLFAVKENYVDTNQINKEVEALKKQYPDKEAFFNFFKK